MSIENPVRDRRALPTAVRVTLLVALAAAALVSVATTVSTIAGIVGDALANTVSTALLSGTALPAADLHGRLTEGSWRIADVVVRDVPGGIVALGVAADIAGVAARLALGTALVLLLLSVLRRAPFHDRSALLVTVAGGIVAIGALLQVGLGVLRDWMLADLLTQDGNGTWPSTSVFDPTLLAVGFGIMVVGLLLSYGSQLQREIEGLV